MSFVCPAGKVPELVGKADYVVFFNSSILTHIYSLSVWAGAKGGPILSDVAYIYLVSKNTTSILITFFVAPKS
jgi:hypothetical protein